MKIDEIDRLVPILKRYQIKDAKLNLRYYLELQYRLFEYFWDEERMVNERAAEIFEQEVSFWQKPFLNEEEAIKKYREIVFKEERPEIRLVVDGFMNSSLYYPDELKELIDELLIYQEIFDLEAFGEELANADVMYYLKGDGKSIPIAVQRN